MARSSGWLTSWLNGIEAIVVAGLAAELDVARPASVATPSPGTRR